MPGDDFLMPVDDEGVRRRSTRDLSRETRLGVRDAASQEGLALGPVEYEVGGATQAGVNFDAPDPAPATEPEPEPEPAPAPSSSSRADELRVALAQVTRNQLGRFVSIEKLRACSPGGCDVPEGDVPADVGAQLDEHAAFLESLEDMLRDLGGDGADLADVVSSYHSRLVAQRDELIGAARATEREVEEGETARVWVSGPLGDVWDEGVLTPQQRSRLALLLTNWGRKTRYAQSGGPVFKDYQGRKVLAQKSARIDLAHPFAREVGITDAVLESMRDPNDARLWEADGDWLEDYADQGAAWAASESEARARAEALGDL